MVMTRKPSQSRSTPTTPAVPSSRPDGERTLDWAGDIGDPVTVTGTVTRKERVLGRRYSTVSTLLELDCGTSIVTLFSTALWAEDAQPGHQLTISGIVKRHQRFKGTPQTLIGWPKLIDTTNPAGTDPEGDPKAQLTQAWPPGGKAHPRRRFPVDQDPPAAPLFEDAPTVPSGEQP